MLIVLFALAVIGVAAFALWRMYDGDAELAATTSRTTTSSTTASSSAPTTEAPTTEPTATASPKCEGPDTQFNVSGTQQESLLPDCGALVVTLEEQRKSGLGLGCGGSYPIILYKTTTSGGRTSICGEDSSAENFRLVTRPRGGKVLDLPGRYDPQLDAFVAKDGGTSYAVLAYNGSLVVTKSGKSTTQTSDDDWISLDNESDYD